MLLIIMGLAVGAILGSVLLGDQGWELGAVLGAFGSILLQQMQKIRELESTLMNIQDDLLKLSPQKAKGDQQKQSPPITHTVAKPSAAIKPSADNQAQKIQAEKSQASNSTDKAEFPNLDLPSGSPKYPTANFQKVRPPVVPVSPPEPREPNLVDKLALAVRRFFTEGNPIVRIGMVVMFFGLSFLVKYASGQGLFPIEFRLSGVLLGAIALLVFGWKTRLRPGAYGLVLQGGGIAVIYLTLFAAAKIYGLMPLGIAFGLLFLVVMLGVLLALLQNAQVLAILATAGGFLAPILTSTGQGSHVGLFSFYLILNLGILAIAVYKAWRLLNWVGFMFTFAITTAWGVLQYEPAFYASTQPFLIAFFALYLGVAILFSFKQPTNLKGMVDGSLVFGLPLIAFGLQAKLLSHTDHGVAISAVVLSGIYLLLAGIMGKRYLQSHRVLVESFLALGISFATLAVPLALNASWTSVTWALEATGLVWVGLRQQRLRPRVVGYLLHCAAVFSLIVVQQINTGDLPIIRGDFLGLVLLAASSLVIAYLVQLFNLATRGFEKYLGHGAMILGLLWWFVAGVSEILAHVSDQNAFAAILLFTALTGASVMQVGKKLSWQALQQSLFGFLPFVIFVSLAAFLSGESYVHPLQWFAAVSVLVFLAMHYWFLFRSEKLSQKHLLSAWHIVGAWWIFALIFWEASWQMDHYGLRGTSSLMLWFAAIVVPVILVIGTALKKFWPFISFERDYKNWVPAPLFLLSALWFFGVCYKASYEYYLPVINPLDLGQFAIILIFAYAVKHQFMDRLTFLTNSLRLAGLGVMLFVWANVITLRAVAYYQVLPYDFDELWDAGQVQMALSILWTLCALLVMNLSRRLQARQLWIVGAGLLGVVVLKLAVKDMAGAGTLAGIVSFIVVGCLMLVIGFVSPMPAKKIDATEPQESPNE